MLKLDRNSSGYFSVGLFVFMLLWKIFEQIYAHTTIMNEQQANNKKKTIRFLLDI